MTASTTLGGFDVNPDWRSLLSQISPPPNLQSPQIQCQLDLGLQPFSFRLKFGANQMETIAKPFYIKPFQTGFKRFFGKENEQTG
jgi:hypothetical protein